MSRIVITKREAKEDARRAIPSLCFTEDDIRERFVQEEQWEDLSDDQKKDAIQSLMDAGEYDHAAKLANEAITEAVARYLHDAMLEKEEWQEGSELAFNLPRSPDPAPAYCHSLCAELEFMGRWQRKWFCPTLQFVRPCVARHW